jgi:hypothetical protein
MVAAKDGASWEWLVKSAFSLLLRAETLAPRRGPGRKPDISDASMAALIMAATLKRKKTKSAQYRFLCQHRAQLCQLLRLERIPARSTYFARFQRANRILQIAIYLHSLQAQEEGLIHTRVVAVDKSVVPARGQPWPQAAKRAGRRPVGVDIEAGWTYSSHHGWQYGFGYEVVVTAENDVVWPILASVEPANRSECRMFADKIPLLPEETVYVLADKAYDSNEVGEAIEQLPSGRRSGRRFLCPQIYRRGEHRRPAIPRVEAGARRRHRELRQARRRFHESARGHRLFARRSMTVEPFHQWFKTHFELTERCWHRGLANNRTQILAALFGYQLALRCHWLFGHTNCQIAWILDGL